MVSEHFTSIKETLDRLYRLHGPEEAQRIVNEKMKSVTTGWVQQGQEWLSKVVTSIASGLGEAFSKRQMVGAASQTFQIATKVLSIINWIVDKFRVVIQLIDLMVTHTTQFDSELKKCFYQRTATSGPERTDVSDEEVNQFQHKVQNDMKTTLGHEAGQMIKSWTTQVLQTASKQVVTLAARNDKKAYREHKEKGYRDELRRLKEERRRNAQSDGRESAEDKVAPPSEAHVKACLDLMRKTKDPKLFAALIREGVPADRFCVDALSGALPAILQKFGVDVSKMPIRIESSDDRFSHDSSTTDDPNAVVIKVERAVEGQSMGHFYSPDGNGDSNVKSEGRYDCMFDCLAQQIKEKYNVELNSTQLREVAATMVETDQSVSQAIRNGWHQYTLNQGFYGGAELYRSVEDSYGRAGRYGDIKNFSQKGMIEADHQPAKSMWKKEAKEAWVRNLDPNDFPAMSIPKELHKETLNYAYKAKSSSEFNAQQKQYMNEGNYKEAIFHAVNENWLKPIFQNEPASTIDKVYNNVTSNYLETAVNAGLIDNHEAEELKIRIARSYNDAPSIQERKRNQ